LTKGGFPQDSDAAFAIDTPACRLRLRHRLINFAAVAFSDRDNDYDQLLIGTS
jgi:hypothetical protein